MSSNEPMEREDAVAIMEALFDIRAKVDRILYLLGDEDEQEEEEEADS